MGGCTSKDKTVAEAEGCVIFSFHFLSISISPIRSLSSLLYNVAPADDDELMTMMSLESTRRIVECVRK